MPTNQAVCEWGFFSSHRLWMAKSKLKYVVGAPPCLWIIGSIHGTNGFRSPGLLWIVNIFLVFNKIWLMLILFVNSGDDLRHHRAFLYELPVCEQMAFHKFSCQQEICSQIFGKMCKKNPIWGSMSCTFIWTWTNPTNRLAVLARSRWLRRRGLHLPQETVEGQRARLARRVSYHRYHRML